MPMQMLRWLGVAAGLGLAACSGTHDSHRLSAAAQAKPAPVPQEYDVPSLVGLSADELAARLGPPQPAPADYHDPVAQPLEQRSSLRDSSALFRAGELPIVATFDAKSHHVIDLVVLGANEEQLIQRANLSLTAPKYLLLSVFRARPAGSFLGLRVVARTMPQP